MVSGQIWACHWYSLSYYAQAGNMQNTDVLAGNVLQWSDREIYILYRACFGAGLQEVQEVLQPEVLVHSSAGDNTDSPVKTTAYNGIDCTVGPTAENDITSAIMYLEPATNNRYHSFSSLCKSIASLQGSETATSSETNTVSKTVTAPVIETVSKTDVAPENDTVSGRVIASVIDTVSETVTVPETDTVSKGLFTPG
ncbi:hypothetical protein ROHU_007281 [Labeo rohita]|uniref:Uncharacterized protein n=1 Tax=Labeo rohita TaxID=84645 RepID=A0A498MJB1_LABRO|nr:hypothetical protein ROHU_007281 [Labeo rohita]